MPKDINFTVRYRPFRDIGRVATVVATAKASPRYPDTLPLLWYAVAPGAGCSKDFSTARMAVHELISADLGLIESISEGRLV